MYVTNARSCHENTAKTNTKPTKVSMVINFRSLFWGPLKKKWNPKLTKKILQKKPFAFVGNSRKKRGEGGRKGVKPLKHIFYTLDHHPKNLKKHKVFLDFR